MHSLLKNSKVFADGLDHPECVAVHPDGSVWSGDTLKILFGV